MIVCIYRIFVNLTVYDNVALIAIYIDDLHTFENFHSSDMYIVGSMLVALLFRSIITKIKQRINENVLVHIILKEKNEQELISAQLLLSVRYQFVYLTILFLYNWISIHLIYLSLINFINQSLYSM